MPRGGYKSVAIKEDEYNFFKNIWESNEPEYRRKGITTFSGFVLLLLYEAVSKPDEIKSLKQIIANLEGRIT